MAPKSTPASTMGSPTSKVRWRPSTWMESLKAESSESAVRTAEPMAKPLPVAAVVLPRASSESVMARTSLPRKAISARPPALSATGP